MQMFCCFRRPAYDFTVHPTHSLVTPQCSEHYNGRMSKQAHNWSTAVKRSLKKAGLWSSSSPYWHKIQEMQLDCGPLGHYASTCCASTICPFCCETCRSNSVLHHVFVVVVPSVCELSLIISDYWTHGHAARCQ